MYRVKAANTPGDSGYSNEASGTTAAATLKIDDNNWSNPSSWFWYVILPISVVVKNGYLYLLGVESGFLCAPQPCDLPYFNDVERSVCLPCPR